jgi:hypothetical protein
MTAKISISKMSCRSVAPCPARQARQADPQITLQNCRAASLSASTSALTLPKVVSGLCLMPS